jgi:hypothetical protein
MPSPFTRFDLKRRSCPLAYRSLVVRGGARLFANTPEPPSPNPAVVTHLVQLVAHVVTDTTRHENGVAIGDQVDGHWGCEPEN